MGVSNHLLSILNFITALLSIPILGAGIWLATKHSSDCVRFLQWPVIAIGLFILLVSLAGLLGSCCRVTWLLWVYLVVMFLLIVLLFCFTVFAFVVTNKGAGEAVTNAHFKEYHLGDYSWWLQKQVNKASNWDKFKSCLADAKVCNHLDDDYKTSQDFYGADLSSVQSGCCRPPSACGFTFVTATTWSNATSLAADPDCTTWSNDTSQLCYDCNSCKAGVLQNVKQDWRLVAIVNVVMLVILIIVYSVGCCAIRNVRMGKYDGGYA